MRFAALLLALIASPVQADDAAKAIVIKALKATGWENRKGANSTWKDKSTFTMNNESMQFETDFHVSFPDKYRFTMSMKINGADAKLTAILNGDKYWESINGNTAEISGEKLAYIQSELYQLQVLSLAPLVEGTAFALAAGPEAAIDGRKCLGVTVDQKDKPTVKLWFDAESGLPVKLECKVKNEFDGWKDATDEVFLSDWADGVIAKEFRKMKIVRNGKTMIESELSDFKMPERVDPKLYEKP